MDAVTNETTNADARSIVEVVRPIGELKYASEAPAKLNLQVRKSNDTMSMPELVASVKQHGVIFPLITKGDFVVAGNRRLRALRELHGPEHRVRTVDSEQYAGDVRELALATNNSLPMHPIDRFEIIASLVADGMAPDDVAAHYALDDRAFRQLMKLAGLAPFARDLWRDGKITASVAQALTLTNDFKLQKKVYDQAAKEVHGDQAVSVHSVRNRLVGEKQRDVGRLLIFVGKEAYEAKGGKVNEDLFGTDHTVSDTTLLQSLAVDRFNEEVKKYTADGWAWAVSTVGLEGRYMHGDIGEPYTAAKKAKSGVFLTVNALGEVDVELGKVRPQDQRAATQAARPSKAEREASGEKKAPAVMSQAQRTRMRDQLRNATQEALVANGKKIGGLAEETCKIVAASMENGFGVNDDTAHKLRTLIEPKIIDTAIERNFNVEDYFSSSPKEFLLKAIKESGFTEDQAKTSGKSKGDLTKFCIANVVKTGWLPKEFRMPHYKGPYIKAAKRAAAPPKKAAAKKPTKKTAAKKKK